MSIPLRAVALAAALAVTASAAAAQTAPGQVAAFQKIGPVDGGFGGELDGFDRFGISVADLGDLDGDGIIDIAVGADLDDDGGSDRGAVWVLFMNADGTVKAEQKISQTQGTFGPSLNFQCGFGTSVAGIGDLDGDEVPDMVVGAPGIDDGGGDRGAVFVIFLNTDGTAKLTQKISSTTGNLGNQSIKNGDMFGTSIALIGLLDDDELPDIVVGAPSTDDGGGINDPDFGAVWVINLDVDGKVKDKRKISNKSGQFGTGGFSDNPIAQYSAFGSSVAGIGDFNGDGVPDIAVGAEGIDEGAPDPDDTEANLGGFWIVFLDPDGSVKEDFQRFKVSALEGGFTGELDIYDNFGSAITPLGDIDGDGVIDLAVGAHLDDDGGVGVNANHGAVWVVLMNSDATVKSHHKISDTSGNFGGELHDLDSFGRSAAAIGDLNGDGVVDMMVGTHQVDRGVPIAGAVWTLFLNASEWTDLGFALFGTHGEPQLSGAGSMTPGSPIHVQLTGGLQNATAYYVLGIERADLPLFGGVMVPDITPPGRFFYVPLDANGGLSLAGELPLDWPPEIDLIMQVWVADPGGPFGFSASNAVRATQIQ